MKRLILFSLLLGLAACTSETAVEPTVEPTAAAVPPTATIAAVVVEPTALPTNTPPPTDEPATAEPTEPVPTEPPATAVPQPTEMAVIYGRTPEGAFFHGAADAPVTLIDYSDFL